MNLRRCVICHLEEAGRVLSSTWIPFMVFHLSITWPLVHTAKIADRDMSRHSTFY